MKFIRIIPKNSMGQNGTSLNPALNSMGHFGTNPCNTLKNKDKKMTHHTPPQIAIFANKNNDLFAKRNCCVTCVKIYEPRRGERNSNSMKASDFGLPKTDSANRVGVASALSTALCLSAALLLMAEKAQAFEANTWTQNSEILLSGSSHNSEWTKASVNWSSSQTTLTKPKSKPAKRNPPAPLVSLVHLSDGQTAAIMNVIAVAEVSSRGRAEPKDYDAVQHGAKISPPKRPSLMTIQEIFDWVDATPGQHHAIGRYQIIPSTMQRLVDATGGDKSALFDRVTQDKFALILMEWAGYSEFLDGKMTASSFMDELALVWAGLPLKSGKSAYEGYAGNRATVSRSWYHKQFKNIFPERP